MTISYRYSRVAILTLVVLGLLLCAQAAWAERVEQLNPTNYLNDYAGVVDAESAKRINALAEEVQRLTKAQIAVVTIRSLEGAEASDFGNRLFAKWGVGEGKRDRGVLVLLAVDDRKYWTEVGYGLEPILPDGKVGGFGREMVPFLREGRYGDALYMMTTRVANTIAQDAGVQLQSSPRRERARAPTQSAPNLSRLLPLLIFLLFFIFPVLSMLGRRRRYGRTSGCTGCLLPFMLGGSGGYTRGGWGGSGGWGGGFGGGSYGGGGFGGFGGGRSGGGGAGGSW